MCCIKNGSENKLERQLPGTSDRDKCLLVERSRFWLLELLEFFKFKQIAEIAFEAFLIPKSARRQMLSSIMMTLNSKDRTVTRR
jgi:hypothetical protein